MAMLDSGTKTLHLKIVYYGASWAGKTANLGYIAKMLARSGDDVTQKVVDLKGDGTLRLEYLPLSLPPVMGYRLEIMLLTIPGRVSFNVVRKFLLRGVDGIVFVADSLTRQRMRNIQSLQNLTENLGNCGIEIRKVPLVMQFNKRDLAGDVQMVMPTERLQEDLNRDLKAPEFMASAATGMGVRETLKGIVAMTARGALTQIP